MQQYKLLTLTNIIIGLTIIMFIVQNLNPGITMYLGLNGYFLIYELWWQPLSVMFMHGGFAHILMNMFMLYIFFFFVEQSRGKLTFIYLYIFGGIISSILTFAFMYIFNVDLFPGVVGASGALSVIIGYIALKDTYQRKGMIIWILLISFGPLILGLPVAWYGHLLGFIVGWVLGVIKK